MVIDDAYYMNLAIEQAKKGHGRTSPNPLVGAIIVAENRVISLGYHRKAGTPHAEVNAIKAAKGATKGATIYVTLEPCNHTGRTPPCTQAILDCGITRVVVGMLDPNPHVAGNGVGKLIGHGIEVKVGVLEHECKALNYPFIKHITTGRPWVSMKAGLSLDGKISYTQGSGGKITGAEAHRYVHSLRDTHDAILIGVGTALIDNPSLTTRLDGQRGKDPIRVILDSSLRLPLTAKLLNLNSGAGTLIFCNDDAPKINQERLEQKGAEVYRVSTDANDQLLLTEVLDLLGEKNITSVLVEGGAKVHGAFIASDLIDQLYLFFAPFFIGEKGTAVVSGINTENRDQGKKFCNIKTIPVGSDILLTAIRHRNGRQMLNSEVI